MWQEIMVFILAAGSVWFLGRQFFRPAPERKAGCGCAGCSSCSMPNKTQDSKDCNR